jgi:hypothetical protein
MRKFENNLIKYEKRYADSKIFDGKHDPYEIYYNTCSYFNNKKNIGNSDNYVEIYYKYANIYDNDIYKILLEKSDFNNYSIQYLDIIISKEINMLDFIDNIKNFKFLKSFCLIVEVESLFQSKDLLNLVSNLSSLQLLENIGILIFGNINMTKEDEIIILNKFKNIKIKKDEKEEKEEKEEKYFLIELESEIFYEPRNKRLNINKPNILSEIDINFFSS